MNSHKPAIFLLVLFFFISVFLSYQQRETLKMQSVLRQNIDMDELDYHFLAVNFALKNEFPVTGFLTDPKVYNIRFDPKMSSDIDSSVYFNMFNIAGPVHIFIRAPLNSLLVGLAYKIFGVHLNVLIWYNILLLAFSASLLPYIGYKILARKGLIVGLVAAFLFLKFANSEFSFVLMDVEILSNLLFLSIFFTSILVQQSDTFSKRFFLGILIALELLCKPIIWFFIPLFLLFYYYSNKGIVFKTYGKRVSVIFAGMAIAILPWLIYSNQAKKLSEDKRKAWATKVQASMVPPLIYDSIEEFGGKETTSNFIKYIYAHHVTEMGKGQTFISNQFTLGMMFLNNEYCADMNASNWLWPFVRTSYYNTHHLESSNFMKIAYFYIENPSFIYRIPAQRLRISAEAPLIFWLAPALFTMALISRRLLRVKNRNIRPLLILLLFAITYLYIQTAFYADDNQNRLLRVGLFIIPTFIALFVQRQKFDHKISDIFLVSWFSLFFFLLLYGGQRFTKTALAINLFAIVYFSFDMIRLVWAKQEEQ